MEKPSRSLAFRALDDLWLLMRSIPLIILGSVLQKWVPMTRWGHLIGEVHAVPREFRSVVSSHHLSAPSRRLAKAIGRSCTLLPWTPSCLAQAFAGQRLLHSYGQPGAVVIGLKPEGNAEWPAHAWLVSGGEIISGGAISHEYFPASIHSFGDPVGALSSSEPNS